MRLSDCKEKYYCDRRGRKDFKIKEFKWENEIFKKRKKVCHFGEKSRIFSINMVFKTIKILCHTILHLYFDFFFESRQTYAHF